MTNEQLEKKSFLGWTIACISAAVGIAGLAYGVGTQKWCASQVPDDFDKLPKASQDSILERVRQHSPVQNPLGQLPGNLLNGNKS